MPFASCRRVFIRAVVAAATVAVAFASLSGFAAPRKDLGLCPGQGASHARIESVDERLDIVLDDGRILHLAGLEPQRPTPETPDGDATARDQLAAKIRGMEISFTALSAKPDRWGRFPAYVFNEAQPVAKRSVGEDLLRAGRARVKPQSEVHSCVKNWLSAEAEARAAKLGLWADPYYAVIAADDAAAFAEKAASDVIVEGRLTQAIAARIGLRLEFGPKAESRRERNFSVIILQRNVRIFERADMKFEPLIGRVLRVRGLLDMRFGPQIEISSPDEIEVARESEGKALLDVRANQTEAISSAAPKEP
jgi:Staphylococcal nuclease homologue